MKTIVIGIGNPILGDDGIGIVVAKKVMEKMNDPDVVIEEAYTGGMNLLETILGYDKAILIDAIINDDIGIGQVKRIEIEEGGTAHYTSPHDSSFFDALRTVENMGIETVPKHISVFGIGIKRNNTFTETMSPEVKKAVPPAVSMVLNELKKTETIVI